MKAPAESLVCTFDTAVKLVAAGLWSDTYFEWVCDDGAKARVQTRGMFLADDERAIPAYTLQEVLAALPHSVIHEGEWYTLSFNTIDAPVRAYYGPNAGGFSLHLSFPNAVAHDLTAEECARLYLALSAAGLLRAPAPSLA
jgi:hypothetical protein